ncbi:hypothetical protein SAY87_015553 [Trapa incisa]|uniref:Nardilysin-like n=1 Tax=Trapa incisa TaxID=236973 RepID=A0AAN7QUQ6_9MYRT|nr:hypothetical protein SAY87_015553 [Trapa incisa]
MDSCTCTSNDIVIKSPNDRRLYRFIRLDNGLSALLVHDPDIYPDSFPFKFSNCSDLEEDEEGEDVEEEDSDFDEDEYSNDSGFDEGEEDAEPGLLKCGDSHGSSSQSKKAAAAMCIGIGSFCDPYEAQGLAHFLEHMLFMGSTEYPDENEYDSYLSKHGGSSNAYTEAEHTCYHFEVKQEFLKGALQRFSQFFIAPLVKAEAMEREVLAVDSEFNQVLQNDDCRLQQLQCYSSAPAHPFNRFFWGNKKSLVDAMEKGIDLRAHIMQLFESYYYGALMRLVVIGGESLDVLQSWVVELFQGVKEGAQALPVWRMVLPIWKAGKVYRLEAVKDVHVLDLSWTLPCLRQEYLKKSEEYLAHLLGHEGRGSLYSLFKAKGWATSLSAGVGDEGMYRSSLAYIFTMSIRLTDSGLEKIFEIIGCVYQYIKLLRKVPPQEWIFKELQDIGNMEFTFAEEQPQDDYAAELAEHLLVYPAEHVIYGDHVYKIWDEDMIKHLLSFFVPDNMRIDILSKSIDKSKESLFEPWFGSCYIEEDVSPVLLELWKDPLITEEELHLPLRNEFIPHDFSIRSDNTFGVPCDAFYPKCIINESFLKLWYKLDNKFKLPRANAYFRINLKGSYVDAKSCLMTELFILLLKDELNEIIYQASVAKLETSVSFSSDKLELKIYGFNHKLPILLTKILAVAKSFLPSGDRFKVIKEDLDRSLRNTNMKPLSHSSYLRLQLLCKTFYDVDEKLYLLAGLSLDDLKEFVPQLRSQIYVEGLCHGNLAEEEVFGIADIFRKNLSVQPLPMEMRHKEHVICLPSGANFVRDVCVKNKSETNSVVELYFQIVPEFGKESFKMKALIDLFDEIVEEPAFNQLRTKEQLGYVVECSPRVTYRVYGFCFCIQSSKYSPVYLLGRIDNFINGLEELLNGLDDDTFCSYKSGLISKLLEKDPSLSYETDRFWNQIVDKRYIFDFSEREAEELRCIGKDDVLTWYIKYLKQSSPDRRRLAIRVWGCNAHYQDTEEERQHLLSRNTNQTSIDDLTVFKTLASYHPSFC